MKFIVKALYVMQGVAKESGSPYNMKRLVALSDFQGFTRVNKETGQIITDRQGVGYSDVEVTVSDSFYPKLQAFFANEFALKPSPILMDLETSIVSRGRQTETIIVDFSDAFKAKYPALKETA